jgi:hypothetical protein
MSWHPPLPRMKLPCVALCLYFVLAAAVSSALAAAPSATTNAATNITSSGATFNGTVNPNGLTTNVYFEYGTSSSYGNFTPSANFSGTSAIPVQSTLSGASPNTPYHYRVVAGSSGGAAFGLDASFKTSPTPTPTPTATPTYTLSIASSNPSSGVSVNSYVGSGSFVSGTTPTSRSFLSGTTVGVSCPATLTSGNTFQKWKLDGADYDTNTSTSVVMNAAHTLTAVYISPPPNYTLNIASSNPSSGVAVSSYVGNTNFASGTTPTSRSFSSGTTVGVTCPSTLTSGNTFQKWQLDGADYDTNMVTSVVMNSGHTLTAVYVSAPPNYTLNIASSNPSSGVAVSSYVGNSNFLSGTTPMSRSFSSGTTVGVTCPSTLTSGNTFQKWQLDGADYDTNVVTSVLMNSGHTLTAVYVSAPPNYTLNIASLNPSSGVSVSSYVGNSNFLSGTTPMSRSFSSGTTVGVTCPSTLTSGNTFQKWQLDGADYDTNVVTSVLMNSGHTLTAVYVSALPRPDLVPSNVVVTPNSFTVGMPITVSFKVTNQGVGDAIASKTRLRITTSATTTSPNDVSLGDVSTPAISSGQFVTLTPSLTISGVAAGTYYIWASVDNTNVTNQSDGTNDYAHSPAVTITASGLTPPSVQSVNQVTNSDGTVTLTAVSTGSPDIRYQWTKDNQPLGGAIHSSTTVGLSGDYVINLTNGAGTAFGLTHVSANSTPIIAAQPSGGLLKTLYPSPTPNPNWSTVVITHGWQPEGDRNNWMNPPADIAKLAQAIHLRIPNANVLAYLWKDAYSGFLPGPALAATSWAGSDLAGQLRTALGSNYNTASTPIHFVGHSFGTFVNAYAVAKLLPWHVQQCTLLDPPINPLAFIGVKLTNPQWLSGPPSADIFYNNLNPQQVDWVDNYIAGLPYLFYVGGVPVQLGQVGGLVSGSAPQAPRDGEWVGTVDHGTIVPNFYTPTVSLHNGDGFDHSAVVRGGTSDLSKWRPGSTLDRVLDNLISSAIAKLGISYLGVDLVGGASSLIWEFLTQSGSPNGSLTDQVTSGDSSTQFYVSVPANAQSLRFDFLFPQLGNGDWMSVEFNDKTIFTFLGTAFLGSGYDHAEIPVSNIAGQAGVFTVTLHAASTTPTEMRLANFRFNLTSPATLIGPRGGAAITFPQTFTWSLDGSYSAKVYLTATPNAKPGVDPIAVSTEAFSGDGSLSVSAARWANAVAYLGPAQTYYWTVGDANLEDGIFAGWQPFTVAPTVMGNIATRLSVGTGDNAMIGGFIITGTQAKKIIVRGIGPSLNVPGKLANPTLELYQGNTLLESNDDWQQSPNKQAIIDSTIPPTNDLESAIVATLPANNSSYTAILRGANNGTGIGVVEAYDLDPTVDSKLANISTRGFVDTGDNVMIGGTIITGNASASVLLRAIGPSLTNAGVRNALQDPTLELHDANGALIASNDNWIDSPDAAAISATTIPPTDPRESAILKNLTPGNYTAIVRGAGNTTGVAVVEAYQLQ